MGSQPENWSRSICSSTARNYLGGFTRDPQHCEHAEVSVSKPVVRVVGLGPSSAEHLTARTTELLTLSPVVRLRTRIHPAAEAFSEVASYDDFYDSADSFENLYPKIVDDVVQLASTSPNGEVVYAVPGSPMVAERTVELLRLRSEVEVICEPAISVIDV